MTGPTAHGPNPELLAGLDPVRFAAALSQLPVNHPLVVAASLAVETAHTRHDWRTAHQQASHDVSAAADWTRIAAQQITYDELQARRAQPVYPTNDASRTTGHDAKEDTMTSTSTSTSTGTSTGGRDHEPGSGPDSGTNGGRGGGGDTDGPSRRRSGTPTDPAGGPAPAGAGQVVSEVDARFLMAGDRFERDGVEHLVDDTPIPHDGVLTVPTRAGEDATWIEVPDGTWVRLVDTSQVDTSQVDTGRVEADTVGAGRDAAARRMIAMGYGPPVSLDELAGPAGLPDSGPAPTHDDRAQNEDRSQDGGAEDRGQDPGREVPPAGRAADYAQDIDATHAAITAVVDGDGDSAAQYEVVTPVADPAQRLDELRAHLREVELQAAAEHEAVTPGASPAQQLDELHAHLREVELQAAAEGLHPVDHLAPAAGADPTPASTPAEGPAPARGDGAKQGVVDDGFDEDGGDGFDEDGDGFGGGGGAKPDPVLGVISPEQAAARMVEVGHNRADAETMVTEYLAANTARWGEPAGGWVLDPHDLAEIERSYDWVDHYRGETIAAARERAADYAQGWIRTAPHVDRDHSPGYAAHVERQVRTWTDRAAGTPARAEGIYSEDPDPWAVEQDAQDWNRAGVDTDAVPDLWAATTDPDLTAETDRGPDRADREDAGPVRDRRGPDLPDIAPDLATHGPETAARHLSAAVGDVDLPRARELVDAYLAETAARAGVPTVGWGLDRCDLDAIAAERRVAAAHDAVTQTSIEPAAASRPGEGITEQDRRAQLAAWAYADPTDDRADDHTDSAERGMEQQR